MGTYAATVWLGIFYLAAETLTGVIIERTMTPRGTSLRDSLGWYAVLQTDTVTCSGQSLGVYATMEEAAAAADKDKWSVGNMLTYYASRAQRGTCHLGKTDANMGLFFFDVFYVPFGLALWCIISLAYTRCTHDKVNENSSRLPN